MSWIIALAIIFGVLILSSFVIRAFFPKYKRWEPLMLIFEFLSLFTMFID